ARHCESADSCVLKKPMVRVGPLLEACEQITRAEQEAWPRSHSAVKVSTIDAPWPLRAARRWHSWRSPTVTSVSLVTDWPTASVKGAAGVKGKPSASSSESETDSASDGAVGCVLVTVVEKCSVAGNWLSSTSDCPFTVCVQRSSCARAAVERQTAPSAPS